MNIIEAALLIVGFTLAHSAWSVSDLPEGELFVPLAIVESGGERKLLRFEAETQEAAISRGRPTSPLSARASTGGLSRARA